MNQRGTPVSSRILISKLLQLPAVVMDDDSDGGCPVAAFEDTVMAEEWIACQDWPSHYYIYVEAKHGD